MFIAFRISSILDDVFLTSLPEYFIAESGSFRPLPVRMQTAFLPASTRPILFALIIPATEAALAGSARIPSVEARSL